MFLSAKDRCLTWMLRLLAGLTALLVLLIVLFVIRESWSALAAIGMGRWWTDASWHPADDSLSGSFRLWPLLAGTLSVSWLALLLAVPLGLQSAIFLQFYAPRPLAWWYRRVLEVMAGIPSVVYGLWGLVVLVPLVNRLRPPGASLLAGGIILALMILPTLSLLADIALAGVSREYLRAAAALGLSRRATAYRVVLPAARQGLLAALILAFARAVGETMAVLMVCGNVARLPHSLFDPVRTLTATIALEMGYARGDHRSALFVCGLLLLLLVLALVGVTEKLGRTGRSHRAA